MGAVALRGGSLGLTLVVVNVVDVVGVEGEAVVGVVGVVGEEGARLDAEAPRRAERVGEGGVVVMLGRDGSHERPILPSDLCGNSG